MADDAVRKKQSQISSVKDERDSVKRDLASSEEARKDLQSSLETYQEKEKHFEFIESRNKVLEDEILGLKQSLEDLEKNTQIHLKPRYVKKVIDECTFENLRQTKEALRKNLENLPKQSSQQAISARSTVHSVGYDGVACYFRK